MTKFYDWRSVYDFWFPPGLDDADLEAHRQMFVRWFGGGFNPALPRFTGVMAAARAQSLDHWLATPLGRLSLILVLDQFSRGLFAGTPEAYGADPYALQIAEEGLLNGHYSALTRAWEKTFFFLPLGHVEGPDHRTRLERVVALAERIAIEAPERLQPLYQHSANQARGHLEVICRFGRFPHRNQILGRVSTPEEETYLQRGDFVHRRVPPSLTAPRNVRSLPPRRCCDNQKVDKPVMTE
jgi:uncharacterized protein (DUF924 family)